jgi:hypothetical protein
MCIICQSALIYMHASVPLSLLSPELPVFLVRAIEIACSYSCLYFSYIGTSDIKENPPKAMDERIYKAVEKY